MPLTKTEKEEIAGLTADEVLSRLLASKAWTTLASQSQNTAERTRDLMGDPDGDPKRSLFQIVWGTPFGPLVNGKKYSASGLMRIVGAKFAPKKK